MNNNLFPIAKEGWNYIGYAVIAFFIFSVFDFGLLKFLSFVAILFLLFVYRNPEREMQVFQNASVVSPADGTVISIEEIKDKKYAYKVEIEANYLDVGVLRVPMNSSLQHLSVKHGARLSTNEPLAKTLNENAELIFEDEASNRVKVVHLLKNSFDGININVIEGQKVLQSSRYGVMINGVTTLYLPQNFRLNISVGNEVKASQTLVGYFS